MVILMSNGLWVDSITIHVTTAGLDIKRVVSQLHCDFKRVRFEKTVMILKMNLTNKVSRTILIGRLNNI